MFLVGFNLRSAKKYFDIKIICYALRQTVKYLFEKKSKNYLTTVRSGVRSQNRVALSEHNMGWRGR